jgi:hypothetical protein
MLIDFLKANLDVFAWKPSDMKGIPREVAVPKLNIKSGSKLVKQCLRRFNEDKCKAIGEEILMLLSVGFIHEVFHPEWLANPVLVKKKNKKWRMCVDYTSLNKACPKDRFPLPRIDQVVDSTAGCETLCFLDAYSVSYGPPWAHYLSGYQDRLLGGPMGLPDLCRTVPVGVRCKDYGGEVLG